MRTLDSDRIAELRTQLPSTRSCAYLNAGTLGPLPVSTIERMRAQSEREAMERQPVLLWQNLAASQELARSRFAQLAEADQSQVALMHTTHAGINACLWGIDVEAGDNIVTTTQEHPGVLVPLRVQRDRRGVEIRHAEWGAPAGHDHDDSLVHRIGRLIDARTRAVVVSHVSWVSGDRIDLVALRGAVPGNVPLIIDGAQAAGALPISIDDGWDAYTVSGQKWTLGPNGSGAVYLRDPERWKPSTGAFFTVVDPTHPLSSPFQDNGRRLEYSQESEVPLHGIASSLEFLLTEVGITQAAAHSEILNAYARERLQATMPAWRLGGDDAASACCGDGAPGCDALSGDAHLLVVRVPSGTAATTVERAAERGISIRNLGDSCLRLSLGFWNVPAEIDQMVELLGEIYGDGR